MNSEPARLGSILLSIQEPKPGFARAFHRWYERDHFYAGVMSGPGFFAGRRWVATRELEAQRVPADQRGSSLVTYWILDGEYDGAVEWAVQRVRGLHEQGRMFSESEQIHTGFYRHQLEVGREPDGVPAALALDHPFGSIAIVWVEGVPTEAGLRSLLVDTARSTSPGPELCLTFSALPLPGGAPASTPRNSELHSRTLCLFFGDEAPDEESMSRLVTAIDQHGFGPVSVAMAFVPTVPGTDRYIDEL